MNDRYNNTALLDEMYARDNCVPVTSPNSTHEMDTAVLSTVSSMNCPSHTDKISMMTFMYGGTFITPWVATFRNQIEIHNFFPFDDLIMKDIDGPL